MDVAEALSTMIIGGLIASVMVTAVIILLAIIIIRAICNYAAKRNAELFKYDYLAQRIAEEIVKRMIIIEKQKTPEQQTTPEETTTTQIYD